MPVTISFPPQQTTIGPGLGVNFSSTFPGPFPADAQWQVNLSLQPAFVQPIITWTRPCTGSTTSMLVMADENWVEFKQAFRPVDDGGVQINARIVTSTSLLDEGALGAFWDATSGLGWQAEALAKMQGSVTGGFTEEDRALLSSVSIATQVLGDPADLVVQAASGPIPFTLAQLFARTSLDRLILEEMTSGPTCEPVRINLAPIAQYAIVVRLTTVPEDITFRTPDGEWAFPDLAVLRIFRGEDLLFRRGIHTPTFETEAPWAWGWNFLDKGLLGIPPPATRVWVDWREGCCGQVFIRHLP